MRWEADRCSSTINVGEPRARRWTYHWEVIGDLNGDKLLWNLFNSTIKSVPLNSSSELHDILWYHVGFPKTRSKSDSWHFFKNLYYREGSTSVTVDQNASNSSLNSSTINFFALWDSIAHNSYSHRFSRPKEQNNMPGNSQIPSQLFCPFNANGEESRTNRSHEPVPLFSTGAYPSSIFMRNHSKSHTDVLGDALSILRRAGSDKQLLPHGQSSPRSETQMQWKWLHHSHKNHPKPAIHIRREEQPQVLLYAQTQQDYTIILFLPIQRNTTNRTF